MTEAQRQAVTPTLQQLAWLMQESNNLLQGSCTPVVIVGMRVAIHGRVIEATIKHGDGHVTHIIAPIMFSQPIVFANAAYLTLLVREPSVQDALDDDVHAPPENVSLFDWSGMSVSHPGERHNVDLDTDTDEDSASEPEPEGPFLH